MTLKNTKNIALLAVLTVILSLSALGTGTAFGWHDFNQKTWATSNNAYLCESNLTNITYELISPCSKAKEAVASWNGVSGSSWTLTYTAGSKAPIHLMSGETSKDEFVGEAFPHSHKITKKIVGAEIMFDLDYGFTDVSKKNSNTTYYDFESIALHEFGHVQWVGHSVLNSDSVMKVGLAPNTIEDTPEKHDKDVLKARYP